MRNKITIISAIGVIVISLLLAASNALADNTYNIEYTNGELLGSNNVTINASLVDSLSPIIKISNNTTLTADSDKISTGYLYATYSNNQCQEVKYVTISENNPITENDHVSYRLSQGNYATTIDFKNVSLDANTTGTYAVGLVGGVLYSGYQIYNDASCRTTTSGISSLPNTPNPNDLKRIFVEMNLKVYENNNPLQEDNLYFGLTDIDRAQSYKILNQGNELEKSRMFARSSSDLQSSSDTYRNMYVENGKYIYSEYRHNNTNGSLNLQDISNVYTFINQETQQNGLNLVLGFVVPAYNGIEYYRSNIVENVHINYDSDANGNITGRPQEDIAKGGNPSGSSSRPNTNYEFSHWIVDKPVTLENGTSISTDYHLTNAEVRQIIVNEDITLTAIHVESQPINPDPDVETVQINYTSDEHGAIDGKTKENVAINGHPTGSSSRPKDNYTFSHWVANKDVRLLNDDTIKADEPISSEQILSIIVTEELTLTAIHEKIHEELPDDVPVVPNTGLFTNNNGGGVLTALFLGLPIIAILFGLIPRFTRKKIHFDNHN